MRALIFDLDGTLVDTVYAHTVAWQQALGEVGVAAEAWRIHRKIGMSGKLFAKALARDAGVELSTEALERAEARHLELFRRGSRPRPLPGAKELLARLRELGVAHAIGTSGKKAEIEDSLAGLALPPETIVVDGDDVEKAKPEPDVFQACRERLGVAAADCYAVGDAIWDLLAARRAGMLGVGLLSGGYGADELAGAGAYRVYRDAAVLLRSLDELGIAT
jgi:HAD superfamily hydrolase (TIGR01509 family)